MSDSLLNFLLFQPAHLSRASSISSLTDSTLSLNIITVTLNMETVNFLGISIVGQSNQVRPVVLCPG